MRGPSHLSYWKRVFRAYVLGGKSQLTFWHERPEVNQDASFQELRQYYMPFLDKANYPGPFDKKGVPLLNYHGEIGIQYNPIAVSQYGLAHYNLYKKSGSKKNLEIAIKQADWLVDNLEANQSGIRVWMHHFDWEYRDKLKAPWYSALAQGNGISLLVRIYLETKEEKYLKACKEAFKPFLGITKEGGVVYIDKAGYYWLEEYIVQPPTHILNGFIWSLFGIYDYYLLTSDPVAKELFDKCIQTLKNNLSKYDTGFWSLYEQSGTKMKMLASPFYHDLHVVQLKILHKMTGEPVFSEYAEKWESYKKNWFFRKRALVYKIIFKIFYY